MSTLVDEEAHKALVASPAIPEHLAFIDTAAFGNMLKEEKQSVDRYASDTSKLLKNLEAADRRDEMKNGKNPCQLFMDKHVAPVRHPLFLTSIMSSVPYFAAGTTSATSFGARLPWNVFTGAMTAGAHQATERWAKWYDYHERLRKFFNERGEDYDAHIRLTNHIDESLVNRKRGEKELTERQKAENERSLKAFHLKLSGFSNYLEAYLAGLRHLESVGKERSITREDIEAAVATVSANLKPLQDSRKPTRRQGKPKK